MSTRSGRLAGKIALITGIADDMGRAAALLFAAEGATVVGCDLKVRESEETVEMVRRDGGAMTSVHPVDLGDSARARDWIDAAAAEHGRIDVLFNNASAERTSSIAELSLEDWDFTIRNELDLVFYACRSVWRHMIAAGGGSIINTASVCGSFADPTTRGALAHAAAKGGVLALTRVLACEGAPHGIRANSLSPGIVEAPKSAACGLRERRELHLRRVMLNRVGQPEEISSVALFLASDESSFVTGADYVVDGGFSAW